MEQIVRDRRYLSFPMLRLTLGVGVLMFLIFAVAAFSWVMSRKVHETIDSQLEIERSIQQVDHYGDVLWLSMRLVVENGDAVAAARYRRIQPQLRRILARLHERVSEENVRSARTIDAADRELIRMEYAALALVGRGRFMEARAIVRGARYEHLANVYLEETRRLAAQSAERLRDLEWRRDSYLQGMVLLCGAALALFVVWWVLLLIPTRRWGNSLQTARRDAEATTITLVKQQLQLEEANRRLFDKVRLDPLTRVLSRHCLNQEVLDSWAAGDRRATASAAIMCDVDNFKQYNDSSGHLAGDAVLRAVAAALAKSARPDGRTYRFGGEEFLVLLSDENSEPLAVAERLRVAIESLQIPNPGVGGRAVTISVGVALTRGYKSPSEWLDAADQALYEAKRLGRNRVWAWPGDAPALASKNGT